MNEMIKYIGDKDNKDKKIILTSDAHWGEKEYDDLTQDKFKPREKRSTPEIPDATLLDTIFNRYRQGNERRFEVLLKEIQKVGEVEYLFFGGDMVSGYGERGLSGPRSQEAINKFKSVLDQFIQPNIARKYVAGGHELGYRLPWSWDAQGGLNEIAIEMFEGNFNQLFFTFQEEQYKFVILSSDLELLTDDSDGATDKILRKKKEQQEFYKDTISEAKKDERIVLLIHDSDALNTMFDFLGKHLSKIEKTFVGHHHAQWVTGLQKYLYLLASSSLGTKSLEFLKQYVAESSLQHLLQKKDNGKIWKQVKMVTIPAPGGSFGVGGGFLVGRLGENGLEIQKHSLPIDYGLVTGK